MTQDDDNVRLHSVDILSISKDILGDSPKVSEQTFVSRILPFIINKNPDVVDLGVWMEYAGSMHTPLDVVGPTGEILFRAPSPLRSVIQIQKRSENGQVPFIEIVTRAKQKSDVHPALGENYLTNALSELDLIRDLDFEESESEWISILKRYKLHTGSTEPTVKDTVSPSEELSVFSDEDDPL